LSVVVDEGLKFKIVFGVKVVARVPRDFGLVVHDALADQEPLFKEEKQSTFVGAVVAVVFVVQQFPEAAGDGSGKPEREQSGPLVFGVVKSRGLVELLGVVCEQCLLA